MIAALLTYIFNAYPQGIRISRMLDPLVQCLIAGASPPSPWLKPEILSAIDGYTQMEEKERFNFGEDWQFVEFPEGFVQIV
jgi:hypothetical protein